MTAGLTAAVYATQEAFINDEHRYVAFLGGRNAGKTRAGSLKAIRMALKGGLGLIGAPSFPALEHGAKRQFLERLAESEEAHTPTRAGVIIPRWGAEVIFATLESESRSRGPNLSWAWVDELDRLADPERWRELKGAVREGDNPQLYGTTTPKGRRIVYDEFVRKPTERHVLYTATTFDNPFIDAADYVSGLGYEGVFYEQEVEAQFVAFEGLVYPSFDRDRIQIVDCTGWATVLGLDVGTRNPTALLTIRHAGERLHIESELYQRGMSSDDITDATEKAYRATKATHVVVDPSAAALIESLTRRGVRCRKADNDILIGVSRVTAALETLTIDPSCTSTIDEFETYRYPDGGRSNVDVPLKVNDHAMDSFRYVTMDLRGRPQGKGGLI